MSKKLITGLTLFLTICFLLLGVLFKDAADKQKGVSASLGTMINGEYTEISSGNIGEDREKYEAFNTGKTIFYILAGVTGVICVMSLIGQRKTK